MRNPAFNEPLGRFIESLPEKPYATVDLRAGLNIVDRGAAIKLPYVQLHGVKRRYLPFDVDREGAAFAWEDAGLPPPTIITTNPINAHAHLAYELAAPVTFLDRYGKGAAHERPMRFYKAVKWAYEQRLQSDSAYAGIITKNPLHSRWQVITHDRLYDLAELADYVDLTGYRPFEAAMGIDSERMEIIPAGYRNDIVFDEARKLAYGQVKLCGGHEELFNVLTGICASINTRCVPPLSHREIIGIARSISKWCWSRRDTIARYQKNRGACGFDMLPPVMEASKRLEEVRNRQKTGANYTNTLQVARTIERITTAREKLLSDGARVSVSGVAKMLGLERSWVSKRYGHLFAEGV